MPPKLSPALKEPYLIDYGDSAILVQYDLGDMHYSKPANEAIHALAHSLRLSGNWLEIVPGYDGLLCQFDLSKMSLKASKTLLKKQIKAQKPKANPTGNIIEIPVCYGGDHGPDINAIQKTSKLSKKALIELHSGATYDVCIMGFIPGFAFLSEAPKALHHPRHATPRSLVPAGSIGIAGWQTGIYGLESPGGWQIIGRTPLKLFDKSRPSPFLVKAGDQIRFKPIGAKKFDEISA